MWYIRTSEMKKNRTNKFTKINCKAASIMRRWARGYYLKWKEEAVFSRSFIFNKRQIRNVNRNKVCKDITHRDKNHSSLFCPTCTSEDSVYISREHYLASPVSGPLPKDTTLFRSCTLSFISRCLLLDTNHSFLYNSKQL